MNIPSSYLQVTASLKHYSEKTERLVYARGIGNVTVNVPTTINTKGLVDAIVQQFSLLNDNFRLFKSMHTYSLLYTPGDQLADYLPGGGRPFILDEYKKLVNKSYSRIRFAICTNVDYLCKFYTFII